MRVWSLWVWIIVESAQAIPSEVGLIIPTKALGVRETHNVRSLTKFERT